MYLYLFCVFKQKTAYEMRISDWSSDVCSSDIMKLDEKTYIYMDYFDNKTMVGTKFTLDNFKGDELTKKLVADEIKWDSLKRTWKITNYSIRYVNGQIGRASCRDRVWQYV